VRYDHYSGRKASKGIVFSSPTRVVAQSKVWVWSRFHAGIAGSNSV